MLSWVPRPPGIHPARELTPVPLYVTQSECPEPELFLLPDNVEEACQEPQEPGLRIASQTPICPLKTFSTPPKQYILPLKHLSYFQVQSPSPLTGSVFVFRKQPFLTKCTEIAIYLLELPRETGSSLSNASTSKLQAVIFGVIIRDQDT